LDSLKKWKDSKGQLTERVSNTLLGQDGIRSWEVALLICYMPYRLNAMPYRLLY